MQKVKIIYTNWKGETRERLILPHHIYWGTTCYHPVEQWLMIATDLEKDEYRHFAMKDIKSWTPIEEK